MDFINSALDEIQRLIAPIALNPSINWKLYVQTFSWSITLFETYLLCAFYILTTEPTLTASSAALQATSISPIFEDRAARCSSEAF